jgi:hypothetical protein
MRQSQSKPPQISLEKERMIRKESQTSTRGTEVAEAITAPYFLKKIFLIKIVFAEHTVQEIQQGNSQYSLFILIGRTIPFNAHVTCAFL